MKKARIGIFDSGIGGLSALKEIKKIMPSVSCVYLGDNGNAPYGNRTLNDLFPLAMRGIDKLLSEDLCCIVVACNTLSVNLLDKLKEYSPVPLFGVFPPVERVLVRRGGCLLLSTERTAEKYCGINGIKAKGVKGLVADVEKNVFDFDAVRLDDYFEKDGDCVNYGQKFPLILGCTHFSLIKNKFFDYFCPPQIFMGETYTAKTVRKFVSGLNKSDIYCQNSTIFLGNYADFNEEVWSRVVNVGEKE